MSDPSLWDEVLAEVAPEKPAKKSRKTKAVEPPPELEPEPQPEPEVDPFATQEPQVDRLEPPMAVPEGFKLPPWVALSPQWSPDDAIPALGRAYVGKREPVPVRPKGKTWHAENRRLGIADFDKHLSGEHLLGAYLMDGQDRTGVAVLDIDAEGAFREELLASENPPALIELGCVALHYAREFAFAFGVPAFATLTGGKGAHIIFRLEERSPAWIVRRQMVWTCVRLGLVRDKLQWGDDAKEFFIECFPKQDQAGDGLGNLIRLPYGTDPGTGRRSMVVLDPLAKNKPQTISGIDGLIRGLEWRYNAREWANRMAQAGPDGYEVSAMLDWFQVRGVAGDDARALLTRVWDLTGGVDGPQIVNAAGQVIATAGCYDLNLALGLLADLENGAEMP